VDWRGSKFQYPHISGFRFPRQWEFNVSGIPEFSIRIIDIADELYCLLNRKSTILMTDPVECELRNFVAI